MDMFGDGDDDSGVSLKRLLKMRKWIAAVCMPLLLFHLGFLDAEGLVGTIPAVAVPEHVIVNFLYGSALFQGVMFGTTLFQFLAYYYYALSKRLSMDPRGDDEAFAHEMKKSTAELMRLKLEPVDVKRDKAIEERQQEIQKLLANNQTAKRMWTRIGWPEMALDVMKIVPIALLWVASVGFHTWMLAFPE
ncbi:MAG: hypothetical protein QM773_13765 [Hyphomonadaceae bacterium]